MRSRRLRLPIALVLVSALIHAAGCAEDTHGDPGYGFSGTVELGGSAPPPATARLVISFGPELVVPSALVGQPAQVQLDLSTVLMPTAYPASFSTGAIGYPYSGQGVAVLDLEGNHTIDAQDLVDVVSFSVDDFDGAYVRDLAFVLTPAGS